MYRADATFPQTPDSPVWYSMMPFGNPGEEALMWNCRGLESTFSDDYVRPTSREPIPTDDAFEDYNAAWPFVPFDEARVECLPYVPPRYTDDVHESYWDSLWSEDEMAFSATSLYSTSRHPVENEEEFRLDERPRRIIPLYSAGDMLALGETAFAPASTEALYEGMKMQRTCIPFQSQFHGIVKKRAEKLEGVSKMHHVLCCQTARQMGRSRNATPGVKGVTQCLRALVRQLLAGTGWIMDSSISKDEATCLVKMLIGPELERRVMIDLPVEHTGRLPTGWKAEHYSNVLAEIIGFYVGNEITKSDAEQYITHRRGPYRLSARFKELLSGRAWPPHLPHPENLRAFGCYREGEASHRCHGKEYTTITIVHPME